MKKQDLLLKQFREMNSLKRKEHSGQFNLLQTSQGMQPLDSGMLIQIKGGQSNSDGGTVPPPAKVN